MARTGVPHIVLHDLCPICTSGHFRPSCVRLSAIFAVSDVLFLRQKSNFFQKGPFSPTDLAENLCVEPQTPFGPKLLLRLGSDFHLMKKKHIFI